LQGEPIARSLNHIRNYIELTNYHPTGQK